MLDSLKDFFSTHLQTPDNQPKTRLHNTIELSAAVLMLEISLADSTLGEEEYSHITKSIQKHFRLDDDKTTQLITLAKQEVDHATSLYEFTRLLNDSLEQKEKRQIIELLWQVANADKVIDKHEEYHIRKIADLLYVSHKDFIKAKLKTTS